jgi:peptidoglycan biosynthesis protein MviN/MurJ (putative lipid II flippase)
MTQSNQVQTYPNQPISLAKPLLIGGGIGLFLISVFLYGVKEPDPEWGKFWMIKPLVIVSVAGACGGAVYYFLNKLNHQGKLNKTVTTLMSLVVYIIGFFLGTVLGLDGTLWD